MRRNTTASNNPFSVLTGGGGGQQVAPKLMIKKKNSGFLQGRNKTSDNGNRTMIFVIIFSIIIILLYALQDNPVEKAAIESIKHSTIVQEIQEELRHIQQQRDTYHHRGPPEPEKPFKTTKDGRTVPNYHLDDLIKTFDTDERSFQSKPVARGVAGRPLEQTPSLATAKRAHIECDINVDSLAYWNTNPDDYQTTFHVPKNNPKIKEYYLSFSPDTGGWNNIRMSMEIIFVLAAITGRTLVLPPKAPLYLLHLDSKNRHRGFADFFPLDTPAFQKQVKVISFDEFLKTNEPTNFQFTIQNKTLKTQVYAASDHCDHRKKSENNCDPVYEYLNLVGQNVNISNDRSCVIFDESYYTTGNDQDMSDENKEYVETICGTKREPYYFTKEFNNEHTLLHFRAGERIYRLLTHFYDFIYFTNPAIGNYYKRFVRDYLHYHDTIYCAAGKIIQAIQLEGLQRSNATRDDEGTGGYAAFHVRRGDLQYKKVKISAEAWYNNTKEVLVPGEILYIATDERDKSFFKPLREHYEIRFLDDYWELGELDALDPNYMGMIDTIIASRGRVFVGTFFSTFSGYINRLRGYHGISMNQSYYSWIPKKYLTHEWNLVADGIYAYEWPDGWVGIDADVNPTKDIF